MRHKMQKWARFKCALWVSRIDIHPPTSLRLCIWHFTTPLQLFMNFRMQYDRPIWFLNRYFHRDMHNKYKHWSSPGDFITAIEAFKTVCKALKDHEGAATEYQEVSKELDGIRDIVDIVKDLPGNTSTSRGEVTELSQALAARAETYRELITRFTKRLNRYNPALGTDAPKGYGPKRSGHCFSRRRWESFG